MSNDLIEDLQPAIKDGFAGVPVGMKEASKSEHHGFWTTIKPHLYVNPINDTGHVKPRLNFVNNKSPLTPGGGCGRVRRLTKECLHQPCGPEFNVARR